MGCILGRKMGMTQAFGDDGEMMPVTVIQAGPCKMLTEKTIDKDGYQAAVVGFEEVEGAKIGKKALLGMFKKYGSGAFKVIREFRDFQPAKQEGSSNDLTVSQFAPGDILLVEGVSKGKGFANVIKLWNFSTGRESHGGNCQRKIGSTGMHTWPAHVIKGKKMPGRMGSESVTIRSVEVVKVMPEDNILLVKGPLPGIRQSLLSIRKLKSAPAKIASGE